jgi:6-phosphogluconolactonase
MKKRVIRFRGEKTRTMVKRVIAAEDSEHLSKLAGDILIDVTAKAIDERGRAAVLVSGGSSVWRAYEAFGSSTEIDWTKVFFFWGDDRFVEPDNPYSNFGLVRDALFTHTKGLPKENVFPIDVNVETPAECAKEYSTTIRRFFDLPADGWPVFDLAQVGVGPDGHTASLFPHSTALHVDDQIAVMNHASHKPWVDRITLTFPVFNHCRTVLFLANGAGKADILKKVIEGDPMLDDAPAAYVRPPDGTVLWLLDKPAAAKLTGPVELTY